MLISSRMAPGEFARPDPGLLRARGEDDAGDVAVRAQAHARARLADLGDEARVAWAVEHGYELAVDLPGFKKDEIDLELKDGYLSISAQKGLDKEEEDKKGRVIRQERYAGVCARSFYVGDVKPEDVKAKYESGVLTVTLPKAEPKKLDNKGAITIE